MNYSLPRFGSHWRHRMKGKRGRSLVMPVVRVDTLCECDGCGKRFGVELEVGEDINQYDSFEELVKETVRSGHTVCYTWGVRGKQTVDRFPLSYHVTIQAEMLLCDECSRKCDEYPVDRNLTRDEILKALGHDLEEDVE